MVLSIGITPVFAEEITAPAEAAEEDIEVTAASETDGEIVENIIGSIDEAEDDLETEDATEVSKTHAITTETRNAAGEISGMYTMENVVVTEQEDGTYLVRMHQAAINRNYMAIVPDQTVASKDLATNHEVDWYIGGGADGYWFTIPVASLDDTVYLSFSKTDNVAAGKAWGNVMALTFDKESLSDTDAADVTVAEITINPAVTPEPETVITQLTASSNTAMFNAVSGSIETTGDETVLRFALNGTGYEDLFVGTYEEAMATTSVDPIDTSAWVHYTLNDAGKYEFVIPIEEGQTYVPIAALSASYAKKGSYRWYPRQLTIDYNAKTLLSDDYNNTVAITLTNNNPAFSATAAAINTVGGPNSNNYKETLMLAMADTSFTKAFIGTPEEAAAAETAIAIGAGNIFAIPVFANKTGGAVDYDYLDKEITVSFYNEAAGAWEAQTLIVSKANGSVIVKALPVEPVSVTLTADAQIEGEYIVPPTEFTVESTLSDYYGFTDNITDGVSALDVFLALTEYAFGEDVAPDTITSYFNMTSSGWITTYFGEDTSATSYTKNGEFPDVVNATEVSDDDVLTFWKYVDDYFYTDIYPYYDIPEGIKANKDVTITMTYTGYDSTWNPVTLPVEGAQLYTFDAETLEFEEIEDAITDEEGKVRLTFPEAGTYCIAAKGTDDYDSSIVIVPQYIDVAEADPYVEAAIITQPESVTAKMGDTAAISIETVGDVTYQWYYSKDGQKWYKSAAEGATTDSISFTMKDSMKGQQYRCKVTKDGITLTSAIATINE